MAAVGVATAHPSADSNLHRGIAVCVMCEALISRSKLGIWFHTETGTIHCHALVAEDGGWAEPDDVA